MRFPVRPELTTASAVHGLSLTTTVAVDNSAPFSNHPLALIYRGQSVQINRATSQLRSTFVRKIVRKNKIVPVVSDLPCIIDGDAACEI